ncbi:MAG: laccase domain-containing protein [Atopobiaceae bacterium]|nr:laccase domain-containing protein [Atopobiaceae bacterium]
MNGALLTRNTCGGVTLLSDERRPGGVTLAFTERTGGVSQGPYASLNLGGNCGDDPAAVAENRRRALVALGAGGFDGRLVCPLQVHGDHVVVVNASDDASVREAQQQASAGADAIVCTVPDVPVLLCYADCVPVVLATEGAFAVIHSGWKGTLAKISAKALVALCEEAGVTPAEVNAYIGPCIAGRDYQTSQEIIDQFAAAFGEEVLLPDRHLDLPVAVAATLRDAGVPVGQIAACGISTMTMTDRFYSYRQAGGQCGRHGALAFIPGVRSREV